MKKIHTLISPARVAAGFMKFITIILLIVCNPAIGQITKADYYNKIDNRMFMLSKNKELAFDSVVANVMRLYPQNEDRVRAYYTWIALNIVYDSERLKAMKEDPDRFARKDSSQEAEPVFRKRKAVCEGFSKLMNRFCEASGIQSQMVVGYTRMPEGEIMTDILHAWNAVKIDDTWRLLDITWSNGYVGFFGIYYKHFSDKYFIESTASFITDHLPLDPQWQLSGKPVSKSYFFRTDTLNKYFTAAAFNYNDSIAAYKKQSRDNQEWLDYTHYYRYDPENTRYRNNADYLVYDRATYFLNDALIDLQEYQMFYKNTLSKENTTVNCKKAKVMLEASRNNYKEALNYLKGRTAFSTEVNDQLVKMRRNAGINLDTIAEMLSYINYLQKSATAPKKS